MVAGVVHIVLGARPGGLDDVPAVGSGRGVVDDEGGGGALPRRFLIFVGPAAVIGHRPAVERPLQALGLPIGIVDEDDHLAAHVDTGIVVPVALGRVDAVADEDDVAILEGDARLHLVGVGDHVGAVVEGERAVAAGDAQRRGRRRRLDQRHLLEPGTAIARLHRLAEPLGDIADRALLARRGRGAAFERVGREDLGGRGERRHRDFRRRRRGRGSARWSCRRQGRRGRRGSGADNFIGHSMSGTRLGSALRAGKRALPTTPHQRKRGSRLPGW